MSELTIITNNVPRDVVEAFELSSDERAEFDYLDWAAIDRGEGSAQFVRYKGELIDLAEYSVSYGIPADWQGIRSDTFFSGTLVRYCDDYERVVMARYYS